MSLAERIEAAGVDEQRAILEEAFAYIHKMDDGLAPADWSALNWPFADRFTAMLNAEAYESAAMMLFDNDGYLMIALNNASRFCESRDQIPLHLAAAAIRAGAK